MALGVSVAVANPTITTGEGDTADSSNNFGITWQTSGDTYTPQNSSNSAITQLFLSFNSADTNEGTTEGSNGYAIKASSAIRNLTLTSDKTINMGESGSLEMRAGKYLSGANDKIITLDLSGVTGENYALIGNFKTGGGAGNTNIANFGGNGINGSVTLDGSASTEMYFTGNAGKITGALSITQNSTNIISFANDGTIGGNVTISQGNTTFKNLTSAGTFNLQGGTRTINFTGLNSDPAPTLTANISLTGGTTTINGLNTLSGNINASGNATLYLSNTEVGDISFYKKTYYSWTTSIYGVKSANNISTTGDDGWHETKKMMITFADNASVKGNIATKDESITELVFSQATSATLQDSSGGAINIKAFYGAGALGNYAKNVLIFGANTTAKIGTMSSSGDYGHGVSSGATFNALNFNDDTANSASINQMNSTRSYNIVGKNLITYNTSVTYDSSLFVDDGYRKKKFNGSVAEFVKSTHSASGTFTFGDNSGETISDAIVTYIQGKNYININGNTAIKGNILSNITSSNDSNTASAGHNNLLVLTGISTTLGESGKAISIKVDNSQGQSYNKTSNNTLLLGATTNTLTLSALSASGTYNSDANQNFNALSINSGTTTATITSISAGFGTNIIGKDLITQGDSDGNGSGYNTALFGSNADTPSIQSGFIAEFVKSTHSASGNFTLGTSNTSNAISTSQGGLTYINVSGTTTIKGNILSSTQGTTGGNNNLIVLTGTSATLGESGKAISIKVENSIGDAYVRSSNNTLLLGADSNILNLSELSALGTYSSDARTNFNALSFNNTTDNGDQNIGAVKANNGSNIIGANLITQGDSDGNGSGYNTTLFGNANTPTIQRNNFASTFMSGAHTAKGTYNITSLTIENNVMGGNYINVENLNLTGNVKAHATSTVTNGDRFVENYIYTGNSGVISGEVSASRDSASTVDTKNVITFAGSGANSISGEISASAGSNNISLANNLITLGNITKSGGTNNFTFIGNGTLTLKGQTNNISTLTAYAPSTRSTSASTLVIDGTNNANSTTIDSVKNGGNLVVNFNGQGTDKSATLKISSLTGDTLKAITLGDSSTNNTLDLTALGNTTISEAISVGASQGLNINLTNTALTTNGWTTASGGASVINVGGSGVASANSTLQGKAVELSTLTLQATNGASMTLQNTSTTIGTLTSSSTSGDKLILGYNSPSITTQTNDVSATIESQVDGGNLTLVFNGGEDRSTSLTLNGAENTIQALKLGSSSGSNQSTHNTLILNKGKTTITNAINVGTNSATQEIAFNLANNTELALTGGLTKGDNGFANLNVLANSSATLSGGAVGLTNLNMGLDTSASSLTFKNTTTTIGTLTSNATASLYNTLIMGDGSSSVSVANTADNTIFDLTFNASTNNQAKTFTLTGGENSINQVLVSESDTAIANTLAVTGGSTTIDTITINSGKNLTLALNSNTDASNPSSTLVTVNSAINGANVSFSGGVNPADQIHHSTLWLKGQSNTIASIDSSASNGVILFEGTAGATITSASITSVTAPTTPADPATPSILSTPTTGGSLTFAFRGDGNSNVSVTNGITVGNGATLGISLGGSGNKVVSGNVTLETGSTLLVDFLAGNTANATLGDSNTPFTIGDGSHSIINFHGANSGNLNNGGITVASGATNTVNFLGSATLGGITLQSGATNTINVYGKSRTNQAVEGKVITSDVGAVNNTINLEDYSTLTLLSAQGGEDGSGELKTALSNTLNFLGDNATLKGGFGADTSGTATINVGQVNGANSVSGTIIGQVSNATLAFNAGTSKLTLQNLNGNAIDHTFKTITSNATDGILVFDTSKGVVNATISEGTTISEGKSLSLDFQGSNNTTVATNGGLTIDGTLGIIINGNGEKKVTSNINLNNKGTLLVDFTSGTANVTLGNGGGITIGDGESSIINFRGGKGTLANTLTLNGGTNTLNFFVDGEVGGITLTRGSNNINVEDNRTAKILDTSSVGGVSNTINLKDGATLVLRANNTASDGSGSLNTTLTNTLNFLGDGATLQGGFGAGTSEDPAQTGTATINVGDSNNSTQVVNGVITGNVTSADVTFKANNSTLTLQGATNTLNALGSSAGITGTIILDAKTDAGVNTTITTAVEATSSVGLKFGAGNKAKTFTFSETGNNLSGVEFDESGSTNNTIAFTKGSNTIANAFSITQGQGLTIALGDSTTDSSYAEGDTNTQISLALNGGFTQDGGNATLSVVGNSTADALISGGAIEVDNLDMVAKTSASLTLQNSSVSIGTLTAQKGSYALKLDALNNAVSTTIANTLNGSNLSITLAGSDATKTATLTLNGADNIIDTLSLQGTNNTLALNGSDNTIGSLTLGASSTNNTLALNNGATTISSASGVSVSSNQGITFDLANSTRLNLQALSNEGAMNATLANGSSLNITGAFSNTAGTSSITLADNSSLSTTGITNSGGSTTLALNGTSSITGGITSSDSATTAITLGESAVGKITGDIAFNGTSTANWTFADNSSLALVGSLDNATSTATTIALGNGSSLKISQNFSNATSSNLGLTLAGNSSLAFTTLSNQGTATLALNGASSVAGDISTTAGSMAITFGANGSITGDISTSGSGISTAISLNDGANATITGSINNSNDATTTLTYSTGNATLTLKGGTQEISTLNLSANNSTSILNLANSTTTIGNPTLTLDSSKNLNVNIDSTSSLTLASVTTSNGTLSVNTDDSLNGTLTLAGLTNETGAINNTINVSTLNLSGELSVDRGATNTIKANSITLSGGVISKNHTSDTKNTIIANSIEFATSSSVYAGYNGGKTTKNLFDISGDAKFGNSSLTIIANNNYTDDSANRYKQNIFKFGGKVEGVVDEVTATVVSGDANTRNTANILSFEGSNPQSLTITDVNKADTLSTNGGDNGAKIYANGKSGNIYIGKNLTLNSGATLALKSAFNDSNWSDATYQASNLTLTIQNLNTNGGKNYINVGTLYIGDDAHDGSISASGGGVNNIALGKNSKIKGNITIADSGQNNIVIQGSNATLTLEGKDTEVTTHAITTLNASGANTTLVLDNSNVTTGAMSTTIGTLNGTNLTATLKGKDTTNSATLALNGGTLKALTLGETSTGNILDLSNATSTLSITNQINVENNQDLTIKLKNTTLALNGGLSTSGNGSKIELVGDTSNTSNATLTGGAVALSNLALSATDSNTLTISSSSAVIDSISASGTTSNTIALNGTRTTITSAINVNDKPLSFEVTNSTLVFGSSDNTITSLTSNGGLVDLSVGVKPQTPYAMARSVALASNGASARNTLTINDTFTGEATFKLYASQTQSDRVEFGASQANPYNVAQPSTPSGVAIISITGGNDVFSITESDKVIVATRTDNSVEIVGGESYIGGAKVGVTIGAMDTDANTFIIKNTREIEADPIYQEVASSALAVNYDLYLANFNSLNKRMGELRDDDHNQGVWARVFGGNMSNDFGAGSKTDYLTAQAGYDYSLSVGENARNYMGIALAYGTSSTKGNSSYASNSNNAGLSLDKVNSNMIEVGLYNSYVADSGWYNDTILKFDYIMSEFSLSNGSGVMSETNNFAMVLSDEFGYRYSFAENEKGSWYIDPQVEVAFGYFNQSDFNRAVDSLTTLKATQDSILTLRSRIGASLGKKFTTDKGFASLYVGASYEYDYIEGGDSGVSTREGGLITQLDKVESNGRAVLNVGSNIELTKGARLYIDVEKSFGDKQRTFMQFNLGARYSF